MLKNDWFPKKPSLFTSDDLSEQKKISLINTIHDSLWKTWCKTVDDTITANICISNLVFQFQDFQNPRKDVFLKHLHLLS